MTDEFPEQVAAAFERADAFERGGEGYRVTTTVFEGVVTATEGSEWRTDYTVTVRAPTLGASTVDEVGDAVADGWFDTLERRLEDAPKTTRIDVGLDAFGVERARDEVVVTYGFELGDADRAADVAKAFVEYVEGTYVEGVVPGYQYEGAVAELVDNAQSGGAEGGAGGTPL